MSSSDFDKELGRRIAKILDREYPNISKQEIASLLNVAPPNLSDMFSGKRRFRVEMLCKLAERLNCSVDYLLGRSENPTAIPDKQAALAATGLSESAFDMLCLFKQSPVRMDTINKVLSSAQCLDFVEKLTVSRLKINALQETKAGYRPIADHSEITNLDDAIEFEIYKTFKYLSDFVEGALLTGHLPDFRD